jgi:hypothetical protein
VSLALKNDYMYHAHMLADKTRLLAYRAAMRERIAPGDAAVEIGSGTGILSLIAGSLGAARVEAVEYFGDLCALAEQNSGASAGLRPRFHQTSSYAWRPAAPAAGMFSETIGSWGPEENIVEIFADYAARNPGAAWLMPSRLSLFAQEISAEAIVRDHRTIVDACACATEVSGRAFAVVERELLKAYSSQIQCTVFQAGEVKALSPPLPVHSYELGRDRSSRFAAELTFSSAEANGFHLWFEAQLSENVALSSNLNAPATHWRHLYLPRPSGQRSVTVSYEPATRGFSFVWKP